MKKFCVLFSLLMSTMVFTACGAGIKYSSDSNSSNSSGSKQTKNAELVDLGSDPHAYMLYGTYRNEENYKDEDGSYANEHADDYGYMTLQLEDSEKYEVQILPIQIYADTDFLIYDLSGKTDKELKEEEGLTDQQIGALHEYWQYDHIRASFVERKKYSEDGEYSYSVNTLFTFAYEVVGDKLYMGLEALIMDDEDETNLGYHVQDRKDWVEYSYGFDGLDLILSNGVNQLVQDAIENQQSRRYDQHSGESPG